MCIMYTVLTVTFWTVEPLDVEALVEVPGSDVHGWLLTVAGALVDVGTVMRLW